MEELHSEKQPIIAADQIMVHYGSHETPANNEGIVPTDEPFDDIDGSISARKRTLRVLYLTLLVSSISFFIVIPSLWPLLKRLDQSVTETYLGVVTASYSGGQFLTSFAFGFWSDRRRSIEPLLFSVVLLALGSLMYSFAEVFAEKGIYIVLVARIMQGLSSGCIGVSRSVAVRLTTDTDRANVLAWLSISQSLGFVIGPGVQAAVRPCGTKNFYFNVYTVPCFVIIVLAIINLVLLVLYFREDRDTSKTRRQIQSGVMRRANSYSSGRPDKVMVYLLLGVWFTFTSSFTLSETILSPVVMTEYAWSRSQAVFYVSIYLSAAGIIAVILKRVAVALTERLRARTLLVGALFVMLIGLFLFLPWGPGSPEIQAINFVNKTVNEEDKGGCPYKYKWCHTTPLLPLPQFFVAATVVGIGYPVGAVVHNVLYSKLIGSLSQGKYMGLLTAIGSLARVSGPIYVTAVFESYGLRWTFGIIGFINIVSVFVLLLSWTRLIPYEERNRRRASNNSEYAAGFT